MPNDAANYLLYVCETCGTFSPNEPLPRHALHNVVAIGGEDYEHVSRTAAVHLVLAQWIREGGEASSPGVAIAMREARIHADWFSEEDAEYDNA